MREMGPSFVTVAAQGFYRSRVRNCYPLPRGRKVYFAATFFYGFEKLKKIRKSTCIFEEAVLLYQLRLRNDPPWRKR